MKVQASIQGEKIRVTGKKLDDLQQVIRMLKNEDIETPLQYSNFKQYAHTPKTLVNSEIGYTRSQLEAKRHKRSTRSRQEMNKAKAQAQEAIRPQEAWQKEAKDTKEAYHVKN